MEYAIEIQNLTKTYGKNRGVTNLSFQVEKGTIYGFLGPNGAGKSTTIRSMLGLIHFKEGSIRILGKDSVKEKTTLLRQIGYMPSEIMYYPGMKAGQVIKLAADMRKMNCDAEANRLCEILSVDREKKVEELSLGNRKKISIVCAMQHKPNLFIFDEPTSGLDPLVQDAFFRLILEYNKQGTTCFYSSHVLSEVKNYCEQVAIIKEGRLVTTDSVKNLISGNARKIRIRGMEEKIEFPNARDVIIKEDEMSFVYSGDMSQLISILNGKKITDLYIEEPSLEEIFFSLCCSMFAAILGIGMLAKEEEGHTAEFLHTFPIGRTQIVLSKYAAMFFMLLILNLICTALFVIGLLILEESMDIKSFLLFHGLQFFMHVEIASIAFFISSISRKKLMGIGLGGVLVLYVADMMCRIIPDIEGIKYITPFYYSNAADIFSSGKAEIVPILIGGVLLAASVVGSIWFYSKKDIQ